ncbi:putative bifunctional diguanylate cyclase/phosphodiesterase [Pseudomonas prosekii]|uniref:putative bifunctional diguanylate cyclase/phosphodiesterase n=1 Tax=Pseudomonas prosekii TaxID=1148509 RepID=UPI0011EAC5DA|nr:bifunctional diguanylate cyclase/phosphodiesterase [Pseudomonas prosekii]
MDTSIVSGAFRTARTTILICVISTATMAVALVSERLVFERSFRVASELVTAATSVAANIMLADERLTMSANMAAKTGERRWIDRYNLFIPDIDKAISSATAMASPQATERFEQETRLANDALVAMERSSIRSVEAGNLTDAKAILDSESYAAQKSLLSTSTRKLLDSVITSAEKRIEYVRFIGSFVLTALVGFIIFAFGLLWVMMYRQIRTSEISHKGAEDKLYFMARHDELTGLPNRRTFVEQVAKLLNQRSSLPGCVALAMVDIDHFKDINDTLGHKSGDELIKLLPGRFRLGMPEGAVFARFGGDEFVVALPVLDEKHALDSFESLVECFSDPLEVEGHVLSITISVGVALSPIHAVNPDHLLRLADIALYEAKAQGRNRMQMFNPLLEQSILAQKQIEADLRIALENDEFVLHYQPIFSQNGTRITGLEALLRWQHPLHGMVSPAHFIPIAEDSGLIVLIGEWVMRRAFSDALRWPNERISINLSPMQLRDPSFLSKIQNLLLSTGAEARWFDLEITEGVLLEDNRRVRKLLDDLHDFGFGISLDDFGTGYSSLSYLQNFPFTRLKIDQSFIKTIETSSEAAQIVQAIVSLGIALGLSVIAEGVETMGQHRILANAGCQQMQGFLFGHAQSPKEIDKLLASRKMLREV